MKTEQGAAPLSWCEALEAEYEALYGVPALDGEAPREPEARLRAVHARIHARGPAALCLTGGGVRSATFALGVLQGLAHAGVLKSVDYLSTVSGGGYIGGWLTAWLHRSGATGRGEVMRQLDPAQSGQVGALDDETPVDRVRRTCRYLAPRGGVVSADMWTLLATMGRNLFLNWLVLLPLIAAALLVPNLYYATVHYFVVDNEISPCGWAQLGAPTQTFLSIAVAALGVAGGYVVLTFVGAGGRWSQGRFLALFLTPALVGAVAITLFWSATPCRLDARPTLVLCGIVSAAGWLVISGARHGWRGIAISAVALAALLAMVWFGAHQALPTGTEAGPLAAARAAGMGLLLVLLAALARRVWPHRERGGGSSPLIRVGPYTILGALAGGAVFGGGAYWFAMVPFGFGHPLHELYAAFAVPIVLGLALLSIAVFAGVASAEQDDAALEWWSRCGAWIAIAAVLWAAAGFLVFYMAEVIEAGLRELSRRLSVDHGISTTLMAVAVPLLSSLAGLASGDAGGNGAKPSPVRRLLTRFALPLVIFALLSAMAWANLRVQNALEYHRAPDGGECTAEAIAADLDTPGQCHPYGAGLGEVLMLFAGLTAFALLMSRLIPVNRFSLHGMYRHRLIRTFLGASRQDRSPNAFTGFDSNDDLPLHELADVRPLHVVNVTLNAVESTHVGRHERKAQSFTFSPLHVGNRFLGYRPTAGYADDDGAGGGGVTLGLALAASGAAAGSAMGMYSSKARAFLLTLANARLGLWFGNPQSERTWRRSEPPVGVEPIAREMLGLTTDHNPYVYLSDGGHYENLGLWEMVARRCRFIVISDAGCDPDYGFGDLSNAVRRIRLDLGIPILFAPLTQSRSGQGTTNQHAAIGTIEYSAIDGPGAPDGIILYLKATLSGDEPVDVRNFAACAPQFPHDSTSNQFFDEARFESYRALGYHTVLSVTSGRQGLDSVEALCKAARATLSESRAAAEAAA
jgi:hypothetical protein